MTLKAGLPSISPRAAGWQCVGVFRRNIGPYYLSRLRQHPAEKLPRPLVRGASRTWAGGPSSMIRPSARTTTRSAARRAKPISCVTSNQRHAVTLQIGHHVQHFVLQLWIQGARDFVAQEPVRLHGQGPGDRHALLLAARKLMRITVGMGRQADALEQLVRPASGPLRAFMPRT